MATTNSDPHELAATRARLVPLMAALAVYPGVSIRTGRNEIARGRLPATKIGRGYYVDPDDVAALWAPKLRAVSGTQRETETQRAERQLAEAGIG